MEFASQICTTREQSERLLSLGLKKETADFCHRNNSLDGKPYTTALFVGKHSSDIPAWSFSRLLEIYLTSGEYRNILFVNKEDSFEYLVRHVEVYIKAGYIDENYLTEDYGTRKLRD